MILIHVPEKGYHRYFLLPMAEWPIVPGVSCCDNSWMLEKGRLAYLINTLLIHFYLLTPPSQRRWRSGVAGITIKYIKSKEIYLIPSPSKKVAKKSIFIYPL